MISRAQNDVQEKFLKRNGADETVYPEKQMAVRLANKEASDDIHDVFPLAHDINIVEVGIPRAWNGRTIAELDLRKKHHLNIVAVRRGGQLVIPLPDMVLTPDDALFILGKESDVRKVF